MSDDKIRINAIVAMADANKGIGYKGRLPWYRISISSESLKITEEKYSSLVYCIIFYWISEEFFSPFEVIARRVRILYKRNNTHTEPEQIQCTHIRPIHMERLVSYISDRSARSSLHNSVKYFKQRRLELGC